MFHFEDWASLLLNNQFWPNFLATLIGVILGGIITLYVTYRGIRAQSKANYISTLKTLFSEIQDNEHALRNGEPFNLKIMEKQYKPLFLLLCTQVISGSLSSERLGTLANHKLIATLVNEERKLSLHNLLVSQLMSMLSAQEWDSKIKIDIFNWLYTNLQEKQKIIAQDCLDLMSILEAEIISKASKKGFLRYFELNKKVEKLLNTKA